jgi:hypothetical protein
MKLFNSFQNLEETLSVPIKGVCIWGDIHLNFSFDNVSVLMAPRSFDLQLWFRDDAKYNMLITDTILTSIHPCIDYVWSTQKQFIRDPFTRTASAGKDPFTNTGYEDFELIHSNDNEYFYARNQPFYMFPMLPKNIDPVKLERIFNNNLFQDKLFNDFKINEEPDNIFISNKVRIP